MITWEGGGGFDRYQVTHGSGFDTVFDRDGSGLIEYDGVAIKGGFNLGDGVFLDVDSGDRFLLDDSNGGEVRCGSMARLGWSTSGKAIWVWSLPAICCCPMNRKA